MDAGTDHGRWVAGGRDSQSGGVGVRDCFAGASAGGDVAVDSRIKLIAANARTTHASCGA